MFLLGEESRSEHMPKRKKSEKVRFIEGKEIERQRSCYMAVKQLIFNYFGQLSILDLIIIISLIKKRSCRSNI